MPVVRAVRSARALFTSVEMLAQVAGPGGGLDADGGLQYVMNVARAVLYVDCSAGRTL